MSLIYCILPACISDWLLAAAPGLGWLPAVWSTREKSQKTWCSVTHQFTISNLKSHPWRGPTRFLMMMNSKWKYTRLGSPVDNRPSPKLSHNFVRKKFWYFFFFSYNKHYFFLLNCKVTFDMWHVAFDMWHITSDMWHMTCDT